MLASRVAGFIALAATGCSFAPIDLDGRSCPCVAGYHCERTRCVRDADAAVDGSSACAPTDNNYGPATTTFTIPVNPAPAIFVADVQATYPNVDWANLDRLYIRAGTYDGIYLANLPVRTREHPLVITNTAGQVVSKYITLHDGAGWVLTGRYDPMSGTGDAMFPGHRGGHYVDTQGTYGLYARNPDPTMGAGIDIGGSATAFEVEYVEVAGGGFTSIQMRAEATDMENVRIHDNYVHDGEGFGIWLAPLTDTSTGRFRNARIDHNRVARTLYGAIQAVGTREGCHIDHNSLINATFDWRNSGANAWSFSVTPEADFEIDHNAVESGITGFFELVLTPSAPSGLSVFVHDERYGDSFADIGSIRPSNAVSPLGVRFESNRIGAIHDDPETLYPASRATDALLSITSDVGPITVINNQYEVTPPRPIVDSRAPDVMQMGNATATLGPVPFVDALPGDDADYEIPNTVQWSPTDVRGPAGMQMHTYHRGDHVFRYGHVYVCTVDTSIGEPPDTTPTSWSDLGLPPDDLRTSPTACDVGASP